MTSLTLLYVGESQERSSSKDEVDDKHWQGRIFGLFVAHKRRIGTVMEHIVACPMCNSANQVGQRFCTCCGQSLAHRCAHCKLDIDPSMTVCPYCREPLPLCSTGQSRAIEGSGKPK
jgi:uncharacterized protein YbaR (Trm112 family)